MPSGRKKIGTRLELQIRVDRLSRKNARLRKRLKEERARWDEVCPQGHLRRHDKCDLMCELEALINLEPPTPILPKVLDDHVYHKWVLDSIPPSKTTVDWQKFMKELYKQFDIDLVEQQTGWWVRYPRQWWLVLKTWWNDICTIGGDEHE